MKIDLQNPTYEFLTLILAYIIYVHLYFAKLDIQPRMPGKKKMAAFINESERDEFIDLYFGNSDDENEFEGFGVDDIKLQFFVVVYNFYKERSFISSAIVT
jgi:hypothetical protein